MIFDPKYGSSLMPEEFRAAFESPAPAEAVEQPPPATEQSIEQVPEQADPPAQPVDVAAVAPAAEALSRSQLREMARRRGAVARLEQGCARRGGEPRRG